MPPSRPSNSRLCLRARAQNHDRLLLCYGDRAAGDAAGVGENAHHLCKPCLDKWFSAHNELRVGVGLLPQSRHTCPVCRCVLRGSSLRSSNYCLGLRKLRETWPEGERGAEDEERESDHAKDAESDDGVCSACEDLDGEEGGEDDGDGKDDDEMEVEGEMEEAEDDDDEDDGEEEEEDDDDEEEQAAAEPEPKVDKKVSGVTIAKVKVPDDLGETRVAAIEYNGTRFKVVVPAHLNPGDIFSVTIDRQMASSPNGAPKVDGGAKGGGGARPAAAKGGGGVDAAEAPGGKQLPPEPVRRRTTRQESFEPLVDGLPPLPAIADMYAKRGHYERRKQALKAQQEDEDEEEGEEEDDEEGEEGEEEDDGEEGEEGEEEGEEEEEEEEEMARRSSMPRRVAPRLTRNKDAPRQKRSEAANAAAKIALLASK